MAEGEGERSGIEGCNMTAKSFGWYIARESFPVRLVGAGWSNFGEARPPRVKTLSWTLPFKHYAKLYFGVACVVDSLCVTGPVPSVPWHILQN